MKKILIAIFFLETIMVSSIFSNEKIDLNLNENNFRLFSGNSTSSSISPDAEDKVSTALRILDTVHMVLGGISYAGFLTNDGIGFSLLYNAYNNPNYANDPIKHGLQSAHQAIMLSTYSAYGLNAILGFVTLGLRLYYKRPINTFHVIVGFVTTTLYIFEIISMALTKNAYANNLPYKKELSIAHGVLGVTITLGLTLAIIAIPVGYSHKKVWKLKFKS